ncbi:MAG: hypothetical protein M1814_000767 [Vezdaea aestivalis]|nr:MAG: hypothetical protein M1814_000767 [Vezdaea aestivalis]
MPPERIYIDLTGDSPPPSNHTPRPEPPTQHPIRTPREVSSQPMVHYGVRARVSEPRNQTVPPPARTLPPVRSLRLPGMPPIPSEPREQEPIDRRRLAQVEVALRGRKRRRPIVIDEEELEFDYEEKRLRSFEIIDREDISEEEGSPCHIVSLLGSREDVYEVKIGKIPDCSCPDFLDGHRCKHLLYLLESIYKVPMALLVQDAFLSSVGTPLSRLRSEQPYFPVQFNMSPTCHPQELRAMFRQAPIGDDDEFGGVQVARRPVAGECPVCIVDMDDAQPTTIVWCKVSCGNNLHKECWEKWEASKMEQFGPGAESKDLARKRKGAKAGKKQAGAPHADDAT